MKERCRVRLVRVCIIAADALFKVRGKTGGAENAFVFGAGFGGDNAHANSFCRKTLHQTANPGKQAGVFLCKVLAEFPQTIETGGRVGDAEICQGIGIG